MTQYRIFIGLLLLCLQILIHPARAENHPECSEILTGSVPSLTTPQGSLRDLTEKVLDLTRRTEQSGYIVGNHATYMKSLILELSVMHQYYGSLYATVFPDREDLSKGFADRQEYLTELAAYISSVSKLRELEKWLVNEQGRSPSQTRPYQILRDRLNKILYPKLVSLYSQVVGESSFSSIRDPYPWRLWFQGYSDFLSSLPSLSHEVQTSHLKEFLAQEFRGLHEDMKAVRANELRKMDVAQLEPRVHDLRRRLRTLNIIILKNSYLLDLVETDHDGLDIDPSITTGALQEITNGGRYVDLLPTTSEHPVRFPQLGFYSLTYITAELGKIKDALEKILFLLEIRPDVRRLLGEYEDPQDRKDVEAALAIILNEGREREWAPKSYELLTAVKESHIFLYISAWIKESNVSY